MKGTARGGEIVQVQEGHILRSTSRRDRHSKVYTAKGPRDRRVRLSAHTAIQFYDVQDRLGFDRPSKAIDWLIGKAKAAIDSLNHLPAATTVGGYPDSNPSSSAEPQPPRNPEFSSGGYNPTVTAEDAVLVNTIRSFFPAGDYLSLPLQSFQEGHGSSGINPFQGIDGWSEGRPGFVTAALSSQHQLGLTGFSNREHFQSISLGDNHHQLSWNLHRSLAANSMDHQNPAHPTRACQLSSSDFGTPFEFGYCTATGQGRIYGEEEPDSHV